MNILLNLLMINGCLQTFRVSGEVYIQILKNKNIHIRSRIYNVKIVVKERKCRKNADIQL